MEFVLGLWAGFLIWPYLWMVVIGIFAWGSWGELDDGYIVNWLSCLLICAILWGVFPFIQTYAIGILVLYIPFGLLWSFWRYRAFCKKQIAVNEARKSIKYGQPTIMTKDELRHRLKITSNIDRVLAWVFSWPIGIPARALEDIIMMVKDFILTFCSNIYTKILETSLTTVSDDVIKESEFPKVPKNSIIGGNR